MRLRFITYLVIYRFPWDIQLNLSFTTSQLSDAKNIATLVNAAYRGEFSRQGWTTEADLLDGLRTSIEDISSLPAQDDKMILLAKADEVVVGTVLLLRTEAQDLSYTIKPRKSGSNY